MKNTNSDRPQLLEMINITKTFPGERALDSVSFDLYSGEIHALVGENGAGKSTLIKILGGVYPQYDGEIKIRGELLHFRNVHHAVQTGVAIVFQELSLVQHLSAGENIFLGRAPSRFGILQWDELYSESSEVLKALGLDLDPRAKVAGLGAAQQQLIEIAKALSQKPSILVLDEPTAALTEAETAALFAILRKLRSQDIGIIYISHRLEEVFDISDRITVLRDGRTAGTEYTRKLNQDQVIARMVGRQISQIYPKRKRKPGETILEIRGLCAEDAAGTPVLEDVSLSLRRGEVLGIAGLMGAGRTELLMTIFGAWPGRISGEILIENRRVTITCPADAIVCGMGFVTEDRKGSGLALDQTVLSSMTLVALQEVSGRFITHQLREIAATEPLIGKLRIKAASRFTIANTLSGGTQQKLVLAKWLLSNPRILFLDEPTRGIDIGAKQEIYGIINDLAHSGMAVMVVSSELPEILGLSDRILIMHEGRLTGEFAREQATPEAVMACATGRSLQV